MATRSHGDEYNNQVSGSALTLGIHLTIFIPIAFPQSLSPEVKMIHTGINQYLDVCVDTKHYAKFPYMESSCTQTGLPA